MTSRRRRRRRRRAVGTSEILTLALPGKHVNVT